MLRRPRRYGLPRAASERACRTNTSSRLVRRRRAWNGYPMCMTSLSSVTVRQVELQMVKESAVDVRRNRQLADDQLREAYQRAREVDYQPGSTQVRDLERAEQAYRTARDQWHRAMDRQARDRAALDLQGDLNAAGRWSFPVEPVDAHRPRPAQEVGDASSPSHVVDLTGAGGQTAIGTSNRR